MAEVTFVINDPGSRRAGQVKKDSNDISALLGRKLGDTFNGEIVEMDGYELQITGGTDRAGIPLRKDVHGSVKTKILLTPGVGLRTVPRKGARKKKTVRGGTMDDSIAQINCKITKNGSKPFAEIFPPKPKEEKPAEAK
jgi:small subunit ribosomal protein S6e